MRVDCPVQVEVGKRRKTVYAVCCTTLCASQEAAVQNALRHPCRQLPACDTPPSIAMLTHKALARS